MIKSQVQTQVVIYAIALIVVTVIMIYGYNSIQKMREQAEQVEFIQFKNDLKNAVETLSYATPGDVDKLNLNMPGNYRQVCFVDVPKASTRGFVHYDKVITWSVESGSEDNAFLVKSIAEESMNVGSIRVETDQECDIPPIKNTCLCLNATAGRVKLRLEAMGDSTKISKWQD